MEVSSIFSKKLNELNLAKNDKKFVKAKKIVFESLKFKFDVEIIIFLNL